MTPPLRPAAIALGLLGTVLASPAFGVPDYGVEWGTIGDAGNPPYFRDSNDDGYVGSVGYSYRMSRTELTWSQYAEFVQAYRPYWNSNPNTFALTGGILSTSDGGQTYQVAPGWEHVAAEPGWAFAAMYANWLQNDKGSNADAFTHGAYDTSDWVWDSSHPGRVLSGTFERSPGAEYWIPNDDEWIKAAYYDPNRYGDDQPGYWLNPAQSDDWIPASQTSSAMNNYPPLPVGSFPDTQSPWGLLDLSGGVEEWVENSFATSTSITFFGTRGSAAGDHTWQYNDNINSALRRNLSMTGLGIGLHLASAIPSPSTATCVILATLAICIRRRKGNAI